MNWDIRNLHKNMQIKTLNCAVLMALIAQGIEWFILLMYIVTNKLESEGFTIASYIHYCCIQPMIVYLSAIIIGIISVKQNRFKSIQKTGPLVSICIIAAMVIQRHYTFPIVLMLPCVPVMLSSLYASYNTLTITTIMAIIALTVSTAIAILYGKTPITENLAYNILIGYILLLAMHIVMRFMIQIEIQKVQLIESTFLEKERLQYDSTHDERTKIANLKGLEQIFQQWKKDNGYITILDIDHFKKCNDTYGHAFGDIVLERLGQILMNYESSCVRTGRFGGEEFIVITRNITYEETYTIISNILKKFTNEKYKEIPESIKFTFSAGITYVNSLESMEKNIARADSHLYEAKHRGRNQIIGSKK